MFWCPSWVGLPLVSWQVGDLGDGGASWEAGTSMGTLLIRVLSPCLVGVEEVTVGRGLVGGKRTLGNRVPCGHSPLQGLVSYALGAGVLLGPRGQGVLMSDRRRRLHGGGVLGAESGWG